MRLMVMFVMVITAMKTILIMQALRVFRRMIMMMMKARPGDARQNYHIFVNIYTRNVCTP